MLQQFSVFAAIIIITQETPVSNAELQAYYRRKVGKLGGAGLGGGLQDWMRRLAVSPKRTGKLLFGQL